MTDRRATAARLAALTAAFLGLLALVALASRAGLPWSDADRGSEGRSLAVVARMAGDVLLVAFAALVVGVLVLQIRRPQMGVARLPEDEPEEVEAGGWLARLARRVLPYVLVGVVILLAYVTAREVERRFPSGEEPTAPAGGAENTPSAAPAADTASWVLTAAGVLAVLAVIAAIAIPAVLRRRAARAAERETLETVAVSRVLSRSIDDLRDEPDARRAVIAAYARMETGLAARGYGRRASEAPLEYVSRVLSELGAGRGPVRRLTALFERAKFSRHSVGPDAKEEAIACLVRIRSELR